MIRAAIDRIVELAKANVVTVDDREYSDKTLRPIIDPTAEPVVMHTLSGLVDYIVTNVDTLPENNIMIHIKSHSEVVLVSGLFGAFRQRECFVRCELNRDPHPFNEKMGQERFSIWLQTGFAPTDDLSAVQKVTGTVTEEAARVHEDDGVTQRVTARTGIARKEEVTVPNPVALAPFRTFLEVDQPASKFVYRMWNEGPDGGTPKFSLHTADGGEWKNDAIGRIKEYFNENLPEIPVIA